MEIKLLCKTAKTITFQIVNEKCFYSEENTEVYVNGKKEFITLKNINTVYNLTPDKDYTVYVKNSDGESNKLEVKTEFAAFILDIREFGAVGDGKTLNTFAIQTAIHSAPDNSVIEIPEGDYLTGPVLLKSNITINLAKNARLTALRDREMYPILPASINRPDKTFYLGSWEGEPAGCFASLFTGVSVSNINITGEGTINGNADYETWWKNAKIKRISWRPRTIFLTDCNNINVVGVNIENSPSWTVHPVFSSDLGFFDLRIKNPKDSPNTDGIDPESCRNVTIAGVKFSVGDDCIAIKSGKGKIGRDIGIPSENINIDNCHMEFGHGGVVIGSEMSGGIKNVNIRNCLFENTDRGLRIKTRRGRGGVIDGIHAQNIVMDKVLTPFVINEFYYCDSDGKAEYVWSKEKKEVTEETPVIKNITFKNMVCKNSEVCAGFMYGLPESKIERVMLENLTIDFAGDPKKDIPAMMDFIDPQSRGGFYFNNIKGLEIKNLIVENAEGEEIIRNNVEECF
ncbi:glycoside hydrolase family 28 protein [Sebaldella sp. S0638]|uniref:glycoside hydrolase family 28 protein n=1 Tax=Sebaldella sp. S0638 TaxID=2957809 RepID=UPI0020A12A06|nr:glycoside hydrolase family 28 protein [Sebaldella sp. S0638]MCP1223243.1 glycoside hydrolase family 28 protein [Sebaldella sp. S0638]